MSFSPARPEIVFVVAVAENGVIGNDNAMPWHLRSDLKRFRALTWGHSIVMGRKTFQSIGKALPGRTNIVVSRDGDFHAGGCACVTSLDMAYDVARADCLRRDAASIMVIGGADIFKQWMARADRIEWTTIHASPPGDAVFPAFDRTQWRETARAECKAAANDSADYTYITLQRQSAPAGP